MGRIQTVQRRRIRSNHSVPGCSVAIATVRASWTSSGCAISSVKAMNSCGTRRKTSLSSGRGTWSTTLRTRAPAKRRAPATLCSSSSKKMFCLLALTSVAVTPERFIGLPRRHGEEARARNVAIGDNCVLPRPHHSAQQHGVASVHLYVEGCAQPRLRIEEGWESIHLVLPSSTVAKNSDFRAEKPCQKSGSSFVKATPPQLHCRPSSANFSSASIVSVFEFNHA